jgi:hypothetical protein
LLRRKRHEDQIDQENQNVNIMPGSFGHKKRLELKTNGSDVMSQIIETSSRHHRKISNIDLPEGIELDQEPSHNSASKTSDELEDRNEIEDPFFSQPFSQRQIDIPEFEDQDQINQDIQQRQTPAFHVSTP